MKLNDAVVKIEKYLASSSGTPMIVDLQTKEDYEAIKTHFAVGENVFMATSQYCKDDECPRYDDLYHTLATSTENVFLTGLSAFLRLLGEQEMKQHFQRIVAMSINGHVVVISCGCSPYLQFHDRRIFQSNRVIVVDGVEPILPNVTFSGSKLLTNSSATVFQGIQNFADAVEFAEWDAAMIVTAKNAVQFPFSVVSIHEISGAYDVLCAKERITATIQPEAGTDAQWQYALSRFDEHSSWESIVSQEFGGTDNLAFLISSYQDFDADRQWLYFVGLKLYGAKGNLYLCEVVKNCSNLAEFPKLVFRQILSYAQTDKNFTALYQQRRSILPAFAEQHGIIADFCKVVQSKGKNTIYYLTDATQLEKELMFAQIGQYWSDADNSEISRILRMVYPDLAIYLSDYSYHIPLLNTYFRQYKLCKVKNRISAEFASLVLEQAEKREFNTLLEPRCSKIEQISKDKTVLYFIDALGVEYLAYITQKCHDHGLRIQTKIARCELPSITSINHDFVEIFEQAGCNRVDIKELDDIKHRGKDDFNYETTKLPIHLMWELEIIETAIKRIRAQLESGRYSRAVILSDHGASRLAVINEKENHWEMASKGIHSGRCCPVSELDQKPDYATEENGFYCLANYDRFRGGRKANIEVHGGASLEEVTVPIIEITLKGETENIEVFIQEDFREILVSYRKKAAIELFIGANSDDITVKVNGKTYAAVPTGNDYIYHVDMPDLKKAGTYCADVFENGNNIAENLQFTVKKEGSSERNLL